MSDVEMPALGESVTEGTVTRWLKSVGDSVEVDEPLLEVSTDKVDTEIPSPVAGTLQEIVVDEDETVEVGAKLAVIGDGDASSGSGSAESSDEQDDDQQDDDQQDDGEAAPAAERSEQEQPSVGSGESSGSGGASGTPVTMPALGESVTEGTVTRWLKSEGDSIEVDEPLLEVSTDKVDTEIPSPVAGTIQKILVAEDETVEVGAELAMVGDGSGSGAPSGGEEPEDAGAQDGSGSGEDEDESLADDAEQRQAAEQEAEEKTQPAQASPDAGGDQTSQPGDGDQQDKDHQDKGSESQRPQSGDQEAVDDQPTTSAREASSDGSQAASYVTPLVRKLAAQHEVDLSTVTGTGVGGRIRKQDVLEAAEKARTQAEEPEQPKTEQPAASGKGGKGGKGGKAGAASGGAPASVAAERGTTEKMSRLRKVIATRMVESLQVSAQLTTVVEVDVTRIARLRARAKQSFESREGVRLSFLPFFALATVEALKAHAKVNASIEGDQIVYHAQENLGIAVDTERGLLVPVIKDAGDLNIAGLSRKIADLAERTRTNKITPDELGGGTFTLTNTGSRGALFDTPIINQPQVGILGTGSVVKRPVVVSDADGGESIAVRSMIYLALSYDHRIVDGADATRFLATIKDRLEDGAFEADIGL